MFINGKYETIESAFDAAIQMNMNTRMFNPNRIDNVRALYNAIKTLNDRINSKTLSMDQKDEILAIKAKIYGTISSAHQNNFIKVRFNDENVSVIEMFPSVAEKIKYTLKDSVHNSMFEGDTANVKAGISQMFVGTSDVKAIYFIGKAVS